METIEFTIPSHFLSALFNGDVSGLSDEDDKALDKFTDDNLKRYSMFHAVDDSDAGFMSYHDMRNYGILACDCSTITFDVGCFEKD